MLPALRGALAQSSGNVRYPDIVANLRMDASWGAAQIMGGIHDVAPSYYGTTSATLGPSYETGCFGGVGVKINMPMIGPGDYFSAQFNYTVGAAGYVDDVLRRLLRAASRTPPRAATTPLIMAAAAATSATASSAMASTGSSAASVKPSS